MTTKDWSAEDFFAKAQEFDAQNKKDEALYFYNEAVSLDAGMIKAYQARAVLLLSDGKYQSALEDFDFLASFDKTNEYLKERAVCYENLGDFKNSLELYTRLLLQEISPEAYYNIYKIIQAHPEFKSQVNLSDVSQFMSNYVDEERALKFKEAASEEDLDQKNAFLDLYISLLPPDSKYLYDAYLQKAQAEVFRYRICFNKNFREELKQKENLTEKELNQKYKYNSKALSELNIIYAIQKFNEATRYAADFNEVNCLDDEVKKIVKIANH